MLALLEKVQKPPFIHSISLTHSLSDLFSFKSLLLPLDPHLLSLTLNQNSILVPPFPNPNALFVISNLFVGPSLSPSPTLHAELDQTRIELDLALLLTVYDRFSSLFKLLHLLCIFSQIHQLQETLQRNSRYLC